MASSVTKPDFMTMVRQRYADGIEADRTNRQRDAEDRKFYIGGAHQWDSAALLERKADGRPHETFNRLPQFVKQISGEIRQNKPAIKVLPNDGQTDPELADVYGDIIRHIESGCDAHRVYSKETEKAIIGGCGWWRVKADYCGDSFDQDLIIEGIPNPNAVVCDPDAKQITRSDMMWGFVSELVSRKKFEDQYPDITPSGFDAADMGEWKDGDFIRIAEYWEKNETGKKTIYALQHENGTVTATDEELREKLQGYAGQIVEGQRLNVSHGEPVDGQPPVAVPMSVKGKREVPVYEVRSRLVCGQSVLTDWQEWKGRYIPLVRVVGEEIEANDEVFRSGLTHQAKGDQISYNYSRNAAIEHVGMQPKAPFIGTAKQFADYKALWEQANKRNLPFLPYTPDALAPGAPQRVAPPTMPSAIYQEVEVASEGMKASTGIYDAALGRKSNETSGVAIRARESQGDTATYLFIDNMEAAVTQTGRILVDLIPHYFDDDRVVRIMGEDDRVEAFKKLKELMPDGKSWDDASRGSYDVIVTTGPAYASKRAEAADRLVQLAQVFPALQQVAGDKVIAAMDIPLGGEIADRLRMILPPGIDPEADKERAEAQQENQQPPDPMQQAQHQMLMDKAQADIDDVKAATILKLAQAQAAGLKPQLDAGKLEQEAQRTLVDHQADLAGLANDRMQIAANHHATMTGHALSAEQQAQAARESAQAQKQGSSGGSGEPSEP